MNRAKATYLELVFPPISNQEAHHFKDEPASEYMRESDFYMIGGKAKSRFSSIAFNEKDMEISFEIHVGDEYKSDGIIRISELDSICKLEGDTFGLSFDENSIEIVYEKEDVAYIIDRFTPENILWFRSRNLNGILGIDNFEELFTYDLLYIGIAKVGDSYDRLIKKGHHARQAILSNEPQRYPGARVTDEVFLFLFRLEPLYVSTFGPGDEIDLDFDHQHKKVVADAEKAFVSLLQPNYNTVKFNQYPKGADGLYDSRLDRYSYSIGECITFNTAHGKIKGARNGELGGLLNKADFISVDKTESKLYISGTDFPEQ